MSEDSISRQAAIDSIMEEPSEARYPVFYAEKIRRLPSAQTERPEQPESAKEYCAECDHIEMCRWYPFEGCEFRSQPPAQPKPPDTNVRDMKEMAEVMISKEAFAFVKDDKNYFDFISRETERRLMDRLASILKENGEVVVKMSDLRLNEVRELYSVQLRRQIRWSKLVRCRDCKHRDEGGFCLGRGYPEQLVPDDGYCDKGDRKEVKDD